MLSESVIWNVSYQMISNNSRFSCAQNSRTFVYPPLFSLFRSEAASCICAFGKYGFGILLILISKLRMHFHRINCIIFSTFLFVMLLYFKISLSHRSREMVLVNSSRFQFHFTAFNCNVNEFICQQNCLKCNFFVRHHRLRRRRRCRFVYRMEMAACFVRLHFSFVELVKFHSRIILFANPFWECLFSWYQSMRAITHSFHRMLCCTIQTRSRE